MIDQQLLEFLGIRMGAAFSLQQGILIAAAFCLGYFLITRIPRQHSTWRWAATALLLVAITPLATAGFWYSPNQLGISDWDYYFSLHTTHRQTLLHYGQLPHWNPYICGGTAGIADPEFRFFTPTFLLQLAFGIPVGFRLAIWLSVATGAIGMLMLGKRVGLSLTAALIAATAATFSSVTIIEIVEGHPNVFAAMYIPWIFWAWLAAYRQFASSERKFSNTWTIITALFLVLTFFQGGIYLLMYTAMAYMVLPFLVRRHADAWRATIYSGIWALGLAAIKIIPVLLWLSQFQDRMYASSTYTIPSLHHIFLGRYLHGAENVIPDQGSGWHEYSAYIGPVALLLALVGILTRWKHRLVRTLSIAAILVILVSSSGPILKPFFDQASFVPRSNISRILLFAVIPIALLAGYGFDKLYRRAGRGIWLPAIIIFLLAADLMSLSSALSEQAFVLPRVIEPIPEAAQPLAHSPYTYKTRHKGNDHSRAYEAIIAGYGSMNYCAVLTPPPAVRIITDEVDPGPLLVRLESDEAVSGSYEIVSWTPNKAVFRVLAPGKAKVVLNTNYAKGWYVNNEPAVNIDNRVGWRTPGSGEFEATFEFITPGFAPGMFISLITAMAAALTMRRSGKPVR